MELEELVIRLPRHVKNDYEGFDFFAGMYESLNDAESKKVIFNFSTTTWFEANLVSVLSSLAQMLINNNCKVGMRGVSNSIKTIFKKNGFYSHYNLGNVTDTYGSTIPFKKFHCDDEEGFTQYLNEEVIPKIKLPLDHIQKRRFKNCLQEVFVNVGLHANSNNVFTCGQYYHVGEKVAFTITDIGKTIGFNVRRKLSDETPDSEAIEWATHFGNTTKVAKDGGIGLHLIKEYMCDNGIFQIISGDGFWEQDHGEVYFEKMNTYFGGTIVNIISDLSKSVSFARGPIEF